MENHHSLDSLPSGEELSSVGRKYITLANMLKCHYIISQSPHLRV